MTEEQKQVLLHELEQILDRGPGENSSRWFIDLVALLGNRLIDCQQLTVKEAFTGVDMICQQLLFDFGAREDVIAHYTSVLRTYLHRNEAMH